MRRDRIGLMLVLAWLATMVAASARPAAEEGAVAADPQPLFDPGLYQGLHWRLIGPHRGGRVTAVTGVPQEPDTFYFGAAGGGIWKTTNAGLTYRNISDGYFAVGSIGSIDVADSDPNVIYVGTGSAAIRSNVSTGRGVYKSTDAGRTWSFAGLPDAGQIGAVAIHPNDPDRVYVAALGHPFGPNPERGVYRTRDGAAGWDLVLKVSDRVGAVALAMNPRNPREIYAAMWRGERKPWTIISGSRDSGIYKTKDGGDSWEKLEKGLPHGLVGKIGLSVSPADPSRVYALIEASDGLGGLYRSDDFGAGFQRVSDQKSLLYRPFYYTQVDAHPTDPDTVFVNNEGFFKSRDGGRTFQRMSTPHGDNHDIWINPDNPDIFIQSNDGGVNVTRDGGRTWSTQYNQATAELYQVEVDTRFPYRVYGAQQDNTTISVPSKVSRRPLDPRQDWLEVSGCETGPVVVHPLDPDIVYGGCKGRHSRFNLRTGQVQQYWIYPHFNYGHRTEDMPFRLQRTAPMILSPHDPAVIYHGSQFLHRSLDEGRHWEAISPDLTANEPDKQGYSGGPITRDITGEEVYSTLYAIAESPHRAGVLWVGSNDGPIHISKDGGAHWKEITPPDLPPGGRVNRIEPSPHAPGRAYVAVYRFQLDDWAPYIYRTDDWGETWTRLTDGNNGIPGDSPVRVVREDPDREGLLYAGTEFGIFVSFDAGAHWQSLQLDLPVTPVTDIKVYRQDLVISTMGRSFWILDDVTPLHSIAEASNAAAFLVAPRPAYRARWVGDLERSFPGRAPEYPAMGAMLDYSLREEATGEVRLEVLDQEGHVVWAASSDADVRVEAGERGMRFPVPSARVGQPKLDKSAGMHRVTWNLRYPGAWTESGGRRNNGPPAVPGMYRVRLSVGESVSERPLELRIDPRIEADGVSVDDLREQFELVSRVRDAMTLTQLTIAEARSLQRQLRSVADAVRRTESSQEIVDEASRLRRAMHDVEGLLIQTEEGKVGAQLEPQLVGQIDYLYGMVNASDQRMGQPAYDRFADIEKELQGYLDRFDAVVTEIQNFNKMMAKEGIPRIVATSEKGD